MTKTPILGDDVAIDVNRLIVSRLLVQANSGGGKSYALRRLLEQTFGLVQHIVIDPEGEFHTLREKFDYSLAGPGGEAAATLETAALLPIRLLELGVSAIVDISDLGEHKHAFVAKFLDALVNAPRELWHPVLVVVDEAHRFAPESGKARKKEERKAIEESLAAVIRLMDSGRKRPFCGVLATQRIAKLSKDAAYECNNVLIGRSIGADATRAGEELDLSPREAKQTLRKLQPGNFYVFGPAFSDEVRTVKVGHVITTHPEAGQASPPPTPTPAKIREVLGSLKDLPSDAAKEAHTTEDLRAKVRQLETALAEAKRGTPAPVVRERVVEKPVIDLKALAALHKGIELLAARTAELDVVRDRLAQAKQAVVSEADNLRRFAMQIAPVPTIEIASPQTGRQASPRVVPPAQPVATRKPAGSERRSPDVTAGETAPTKETARTSEADTESILGALATFERMDLAPSVSALAAWLGVHPKTKSLLTNLGSLRADGLLDGMKLTGNGRAVARPTKATIDEQRAMWRSGLSESQQRIIDTIRSLGDMGRAPVTHTTLAVWLGVHPKTKTLLDDLGKLRSRGFLDGNGLTEIGTRASMPKYTDLRTDDLAGPLDTRQRTIVGFALKHGHIDTMTELAGLMGVHPKTKSLLTDIGVLRSRGMVTNGWPLMPTDAWAGAR